LWKALSEMLMRPDHLQRALEMRREAVEEQETWAKDAKSASARLKVLEQRNAEITARFRRGVLSAETYDRHLEEAAREKKMLENQIDGARAASDAARREKARCLAVLATAETLRERLKNANPSIQQEVARILIRGRGESVVRLGAQTIEAHVVFAENPTVLPAFGASSSSVCEQTDDFALSLRVVA